MGDIKYNRISVEGFQILRSQGRKCCSPKQPLNTLFSGLFAKRIRMTICIFLCCHSFKTTRILKIKTEKQLVFQGWVFFWGGWGGGGWWGFFCFLFFGFFLRKEVVCLLEQNKTFLRTSKTLTWKKQQQQKSLPISTFKMFFVFVQISWNETQKCCSASFSTAVQMLPPVFTWHFPNKRHILL